MWGRRDTLIKTSGYRVSPDEIIKAALESGLARDAMAWGEPAEDVGNNIILAVESLEPACTSQAIMNHFRLSMPSYARPSRIAIWLVPFPTTANGKINRSEIIRHSVPGRSIVRSYVAP